MREIKFRFKDLDLGKTFYRKPSHSDFDHPRIVPQQYTGFNDYDYNPIYEGDIVLVRLEDNVEPLGYYMCEMEVKFYMGCWCLFQVGFDYTDSPWEDISILHRETNPIYLKK
jgi:hypothetical protein